MKKAILPSEIDLHFKTSYLLWGWCGLFSILILVCVSRFLPTVFAVAALLMYGLACFWQWLQLPATRWSWSAQSLRVDVYGRMTLTNTFGQTWSFSVRGDSVVHPACIVLHLGNLALTVEGNQTHDTEPLPFLSRFCMPKRLLILPDQADAQTLKALRVWLKWGLQ